jgi:hypothetical protein
MPQRASGSEGEPVPGKIHFPGTDRIDILFLRIPLLLPIVLLTTSFAGGGSILPPEQEKRHTCGTRGRCLGLILLVA